MARNFSSPQQSPRDDIDINGSTYALQVALRNMKERYQKLQRKLSYIEEENQRLLHGKTELFGEIGVMQESSIKLREKNLQLNQELHSKHQENCSLRESYNSVSHQNSSLARDNRLLHAQVSQMLEGVAAQPAGNTDGAVTGGADSSALMQIADELSRLSPDSITPNILPGGNDSDHSEDSIDRAVRAVAEEGVTDHRQEEEEEEEVDSDDDSYRKLFLRSEDASDRMDVIMDEVQRQKFAMKELLQLLVKSSVEGEGAAPHRPPAQCAPTASPAQGEEEADHAAYDSRLATCGSVAGGGHKAVDRRPAGCAAGDRSPCDGRERSPFDWRRVQVSDEDGSQSSEDSDASSELIPQTPYGGLLPQPPAPRVGSREPGSSGDQGYAHMYSPPRIPRHQEQQDDTSRCAPVGGPAASFVATAVGGLYGGSASNALPYNHISPPLVMDENSKICPMCTQVFSKDTAQDVFETHVVGHFEDIDVGFEVVQ